MKTKKNQITIKKTQTKTNRNHLTVNQLAKAMQSVKKMGYNPTSISVNPVSLMLNDLRILYYKNNKIFVITEHELYKMDRISKSQGKMLENLTDDEINEMITAIRM